MYWGILDMSWHDLRRYDKDWHDLLIHDIRTDMIWEEVIWNLLVQELERKLKPNCLHVGLLQGGGDVHMHVQEPGYQGQWRAKLKNVKPYKGCQWPTFPSFLFSLGFTFPSPLPAPLALSPAGKAGRQTWGGTNFKWKYKCTHFYHSKLRCSRLIQKKSTFLKFITLESVQSLKSWSESGRT